MAKTEKEKYDIKEMQSHLLEMLVETDRVCRREGIRYFLSGGTLLGAVRHGGFIPWDDDADIAMPRPDYERFAAHANEWLPPHLAYRDHRTDPNYPFYYGKIEDLRTTIVEGPTRPFIGGVFIDVFPIDGILSDSDISRRNKAFRRKCKLLHFLHRNPYKHGRGPRSWWPLMLRRIYTRRGVCESIRELLARTDYDTSRRVLNFSPNYVSVLPREDVMGEGTPIMFEGHELIGGLKDNDAYLRKQYGDYMKVPPPEKRYSHSFLHVDYSKPYSEYIAEKLADKNGKH